MLSNWRLNFLLTFFILVGLIIGARLFYWQVLSGENLSAIAASQHWVSFEIPAKRGQILASDGHPLVANQEAYLLFASIPQIKDDIAEIANRLSITLEKDDPATMAGLIKERLSRSDLVWVPIKHKLSRKEKSEVETLQIEGLGFEQEQQRSYPEGSASAHLLGFVGSDINGVDKGYFGLEGYYDLELKGRAGLLKREKDASGKPILVGDVEREDEKDGRTLVTTIDRTVQYTIASQLQSAIKRYGAVSGSVIVMRPQDGAILGMVSYPNYDPFLFSDFNKSLFSNPVVASSYEPGSTFKVLVMAAAINEGLVKPETRCDRCSGPRKIAEYTISTWNDEYHPGATMAEVIQYSDNIGMVFVSEKLGIGKMIDYLTKFGLGQKTGIDLEDENTPSLREEKNWSSVDLATASFGQGIAVTPIQMIRAVNVLANKGKLVKPYLVKEMETEEGRISLPKSLTQEVINPTTASILTEMMVNAVDSGEAKWAKLEGYRIAGKTGTAQIPVAGHYDEDKTIASFVGFAPADDPAFIMLVTLREPTTSPWGSETAAPLWFDISKELFTYYGIQPS